MRAIARLIALLFLLGWSLAAQTATPQAQPPVSSPTVPIPLAVAVPTPPTSFRGDGQRFLCYEIYITNLSSTAWTLQRLDVTNENNGLLQTVDGKTFDTVIFHPSRPRDSTSEGSAEIAPGENVIAYLWVILGKDTPTPKRLLHKFSLKRAADQATYSLSAPETTVLDKLPQIASPLRGKNWLAGNGPSNTSQHRRALIVVNGTPYIAQRYAIDWVQLGPDGLTYRGDPKDNKNYYCFGAEALAIAEGVVVEVKDGIPENTPRAKATVVPITLETVAGNHVNVDLGGGVYAMYAHLQPGSIRVKLGDKVALGQVIGLVGNTGNSSEPHLHFQLMDRNSPLASEGVPYTLPAFKLTARISGDVEKPTVNRLPAAATSQDDIPLENELVDFEP